MGAGNGVLGNRKNTSSRGSKFLEPKELRNPGFHLKDRQMWYELVTESNGGISVLLQMSIPEHLTVV